MKFLVDCLIYSFFVGWNILLGGITYSLWRYGSFTTQEPIRWIINMEMGFAALLFAFSIWACVWLVTNRRKKNAT